MILDNIEEFILVQPTNDVKYLLELSKYIEGYMTNPIEVHDIYGELHCRRVVAPTDLIKTYFHDMSLYGHVFLHNLIFNPIHQEYHISYCYKLDELKFNMYESLRTASMQNENRLTDAYEEGRISYEVYVHLLVKNFTLLTDRKS